MILFVNGDSHAAGAEAVSPHGFAEDDGSCWGMGQQPHPDNLAVSFGAELARLMQARFVCHAQSGGSNARIIRTTGDWIQQNPNKLADTVMLIQWSTWERQEWFHQGQWWQVNASGTDHVPVDLQKKYRQYVIDVDWTQCTRQAHEDIWQFHCDLDQAKIPHVFFNANSHFGGTHLQNNLPVPIISNPQSWGSSYIGPYDGACTYHSVLIHNGFKMVDPSTYHFRADAHCFWANFLLQYMIANKYIQS